MKKKIIGIILLLSLVATGILVFQRIQTEESAKTWEMVADYDEFLAFSKQTTYQEQDFWKKLYDVGFTSVALSEDTLYELHRQQAGIEYALALQVKQSVHWQDDYGPEAVKWITQYAEDYHMLVRLSDENLFARLSKELLRKYPLDFFELFDEPTHLTIVLKGTVDDIYYMEAPKVRDNSGKGAKYYRLAVSSAVEDVGLGFNPQKIEMIKNSGLKVLLRPYNYPKVDTKKLIDAYFEDVDHYGSTHSHVIFAGHSVLGYQDNEKSDSEEYFLSQLTQRNISLGMIEAINQRGFVNILGGRSMAEASNYEVVRIFPMIEYLQERYNYLGYYAGSKEIENTIYRAITDRNIRSIYMRPFKSGKYTYHTDFEQYRVMFDHLSDRLAPHGISLSRASTFTYHSVQYWLMMCSAFGLVILSVIFLRFLFSFPVLVEMILYVLGGIGVVLAFWKAPNRAIILASFGASVLFPVLAGTLVVEYIRDILKAKKVYRFGGLYVKVLVGVILGFIVVLIGAMYEAAYLSRPDYLMELNYFRGVKLSLLLPIIIVACVYFMKLGYKRNDVELAEQQDFRKDIKRFLQDDVKVYSILIMLAILLVAAIYILRSGHEGNVNVASFEIRFRNWLENHFIARPRTKELLIGTPALFTALFLAVRGIKKVIFPFVILAMLSFTSVLNTFCHCRTAVYVSFYRSIISLAISFVVGTVLLLIYEGIHRAVVQSKGSVDE